MCAAFAVREHRISEIGGFGVGKEDALAGRRVLMLGPVDDAVILHDLPQGVRARVGRQIRGLLAGGMQAPRRLAGGRKCGRRGHEQQENST